MTQRIFTLLTVFFFLFGQHSLGQTDTLYLSVLKKADSAYDFKWFRDKDGPTDFPKFENAKKLYNQALQIKPKESYPANRIKEIDRIFYDYKTKPIYQKLISKADSFLNLDNYVQATKYYCLADSLYSTTYTKEKLSAVSSLSNLANNPSDSVYFMEHGTSFGMCEGYCFQETKYTKDLIINVSKSWEKEQPDKRDTLKMDKTYWQTIVQAINIKEFYKHSHIIGCPDCTDGGAEWLAIGTKYSTWKIEFDYGADITNLQSLLSIIRLRSK